MKKYFLLILIILAINNTMVFGQIFYRSNSIGMIFEKIPSFRITDFDWVVKIEKDNSLEKRTIFFKGEPEKVFEYIHKDEFLYIKEYSNGDLIRSEKQQEGLILEEDYYKDKTVINKYQYEWSERKLRKTTFIENNEKIYEDRFISQQNGKLLQVRRIYNDEIYSTTGFTYPLKGLQTEWYETEKEFIVFKYKSGRVILIENWNNGVLDRNKIFNYTDRGKTVTETIFLTGETHVQKYDLNDYLLSEEIRNGNNVQKINYLYNESLLIQKNSASPGIREKVFYKYDDDNNLILESFYTDNLLVKEIFYSQGTKQMEKLYNENSLLLIVTYSDNEIIHEEYFK